MNNIQALTFIGKCLTLGKYPGRYKEIIQELKKIDFSWELVVFNASNQYVLPAFYIQLKNAGLHTEMPEELRQHIEEITELNRKRNREIINQVNVISGLLNKNGIELVFLKGTAHLLLELYTDPAERMIGDIDILVKDNEIIRTAELIKTLGFKPHEEYNAALHYEMKHYPSMVNPVYPAAIEIHREVLNSPYDKKFAAEKIINQKQKINKTSEIFVPGKRELIIHNMLNSQINDRNYANARVLLRQSYDLFLLAEKENPDVIFEEFGQFRKESAAWLATSAMLLGYPENLQFRKSASVKWYLLQFLYLQKHRHVLTFYRHIRYFSWRLKRYLIFPVLAVYNPVFRSGIKARLTDKSWYSKQINTYKTYFKPKK